MKCVFLALVLFVVKIHPCPDRWALNQVNVWTQRTINGHGQHRNAINIYDLDNNEMIEVTRANVSVLCDGMIKNFNKLKFLGLIDANISKIQAGAFQNLPALTRLSLAVNRLSSIERYQFQNLERLEILYLSKNHIENVDEDAFYDLVNLRKIFLDRNKIHEIDAKWFLNNGKLSVIDLSLNKFSKVQRGAFPLPANSMVEIRLQNNEIEEVEEGAVTSEAAEEEVPYVTVHLGHNNLKNIPKSFVISMDEFHSTLFFDSNHIECFDPENLRVLKSISVKLDAKNNPLKCDCLEAATNFVKDNEIKAVFNFSSSLDCQLSGLRPDSWNSNYF